MVPFFRGARRYAETRREPIINLFYTHANINKRDLMFLEILDDLGLCSSPIHADKDKCEAIKQRNASRVQKKRMGENTRAHFRINLMKIVDLFVLSMEVLNRGGSGRPKCIVLKKIVTIKQMNFRNRRLGNHVEDVGTRAPQADNPDFLGLGLIGN